MPPPSRKSKTVGEVTAFAANLAHCGTHKEVGASPSVVSE